MNKELEVITEYIEKIEEYEKKTEKQYPAKYMYKEVCIAIKEKLQRLEAIDNANPSEALIYLNKIGNSNYFFGSPSTVDKPEFNTIKQALIKAQELEKVLKILFEKKVDIDLLKDCEDRYKYNMHFPYHESYQLTEEEFDLLKRYFDEIR